MSTLRATNIKNPDSGDNNIVLDGSGGVIISGVTTSSNFVGNVTGDATGLSGTPNLNVGVVTASSFVGNVTGNVTGTLLGTPEIAGISSSISDTAVDIFIYDTRKDSDGGAWRKRTQHTSWYNETLNTATRGSRREFPAVAVIVATADDVLIYDGDDPDMPLWMKFIGSGNARAVRQGMSSITMLNGLMTAGRSGSERAVGFVNFVSDYVYQIANNGKYEFGTGGIINRNTDGSFINVSSGTQIVNNTVNDVAMTVLPNAPIDDATGLPIPTIAVATTGGVSVIKDDGTVVDMSVSSESSAVTKIDFVSPTIFVARVTNNWVDYFYLPSSDLSTTYWVSLSNYIGRYTDTQRSWGTFTESYTIPINTSNSGIANFVSNKAIGHSSGVQILSNSFISGTNFVNGMHAGISTDFNTGWMHGDIKGAFLSDTDATNVTGTELWPEGDFADANEWSSAGAEWTISGGTATVSDGDGGYSFLGNSTGTLTNGKKYVLSFTVSNYSGGRLEASQANSSNIQIPFSANGSYSQLINYTGTTGSGLGMYGYGGGAVGFTLDNLYLRELEEEDRSVNNTGLAVYGTITKSAVATGAELVAYSGFSSSNYLVQPNITPPGTGDFSLSFWIRPETFNVGAGNYFHLFSLGTTSSGGQGSGTGFVLKMTTTSGENSNGYGPYFYSADGTNDKGTFASGNNYKLGIWNHCVAMRKSGIPYFYINGVLVRTGTSWTQNITDTYLTMGVGIGFNEYGGDAKVSLLRYSLSAPSPEQIKKIYEDEKVLFQENAACTLYGSSDAVTALAYDDSTNLLYAGTSSGRSDFQGLRRINNTTTAVTTAISASNGLVAEQ